MISVQDLGKAYHLGENHIRSLREIVNHACNRFFLKAPTPPPAQSNTLPVRSVQTDESSRFWALRDVDFEIPAGQVVGVIGRNGAGKSTLLKILSNIVAPTKGRAELRGRVASLLEVGTGFHPELTGRENVFLNGTILGMTKAEVRRRFDEIVDFAGVDEFIDTPVKRFSSGMTVRLAFAVAAYLESEILIIDEVLAVGDMKFQKKCLGRMQAASSSGRTVLFVSHNMPSVRALTSRSLVFSQGKLIFDGPTGEAIKSYTKENEIVLDSHLSLNEIPRPYGGMTGEIRFESLKVESLQPITEGHKLFVRLGVRFHQPCEDFLFWLTVFRDDESPAGSTFSPPMTIPRTSNESYLFGLSTESLAPGRYHCTVAVAEARSYGHRMYDCLANVLVFEVEPGPSNPEGWAHVWGAIRFPEMQLLETPAPTAAS